MTAAPAFAKQRLYERKRRPAERFAGLLYSKGFLKEGTEK
jgi:hypothetical protein